MGSSASAPFVISAALATAATGLPAPRLDGWKPRSMKTAKERAAHKRRQKLAKASKRRNRG